MMTNQSTIEAMARQIHDSRNPTVLWNETSHDYKIFVTNMAENFVSIAKSLGWQPPQPKDT